MDDYEPGTFMLRAETLYKNKSINQFPYFMETSRLTDIGYPGRYNIFIDEDTNDKLIYVRSSLSGIEKDREYLSLIK